MSEEIDFTLARECFQATLKQRVMAILVKGVTEGRVKVLEGFQIDPETGNEYLEQSLEFDQLAEELTPIALGIYGPDYRLRLQLQRSSEIWN